MPQAAAKQLCLAGWELRVPMSPGAVVAQKSSKQGACPHLLEPAQDFPCGKLLVISPGGEKRSMKRKQVLRMLSPLCAPITPALPGCRLVQISSP